MLPPSPSHPQAPQSPERAVQSHFTSTRPTELIIESEKAEIPGTAGSETGSSSAVSTGSSATSTTLIPSMSDEPSPWLKEHQTSSRRSRRFLTLAGIVIFFGAIAGTIYFFVNRANASRMYTDQASQQPPTQPAASLNLTITRDRRLHKSFYGLNYTPQKSQLPWCGDTLQDVIDDVKIMSQLTPRLRLYGTDCNVANWTLYAINALKINMGVILTVWVDGNSTTYDRQHKDVLNVLKAYGTAHIDGISIGNEVLFRASNQANLSIVAEDLYSKIETVKQELSFNGWGSVPVFTTDVSYETNSTLVNIEDKVSGNIHPYFAGTTVETAANWTIGYTQNNMIPISAGKEFIISEVGWPTEGSTYQGAVPGTDNLQYFLNSFLCRANQISNMPYYFFEAFDEPWKSSYGVLETSWGLFDKNKNLKVNIPDCEVPGR
ncbi:hypothetical protein BZG36_02436 [Bifiguratus adelaidae]|uniref:glucan endo-1,3-beta-D-glucosidase n=1 Tax=Bifiguratus adelaidae TaxID=1938954 RepID=A0A261Y3L0_9FUNG|nr:hypothetical protein BZG36_02436 [Bifiguratus adelaidae]